MQNSIQGEGSTAVKSEETLFISTTQESLLIDADYSNWSVRIDWILIAKKHEKPHGRGKAGV
jgi:hypothetical protein